MWRVLGRTPPLPLTTYLGTRGVFFLYSFTKYSCNYEVTTAKGESKVQLELYFRFVFFFFVITVTFYGCDVYMLWRGLPSLPGDVLYVGVGEAATDHSHS